MSCPRSPDQLSNMYLSQLVLIPSWLSTGQDLQPIRATERVTQQQQPSCFFLLPSGAPISHPTPGRDWVRVRDQAGSIRQSKYNTSSQICPVPRLRMPRTYQRTENNRQCFCNVFVGGDGRGVCSMYGRCLSWPCLRIGLQSHRWFISRSSTLIDIMRPLISWDTLDNSVVRAGGQSLVGTRTDAHTHLCACVHIR